MTKTILITGGSGFIGKELTRALINKGYTVHLLSRSAATHPKANVKTFTWDVYKKQVDPHCINHVEAIIHLAGEGVADKRWTNKRKNQLLESRTESIRLIYSLLKQSNNHSVKTVISASAIGYYGNAGNELQTEENKASDSFLAKLCVAWEQAVNEGEGLGLRIVHLRTGIVLASAWGALSPLIKSVQWRLGSPLGTGKQWMSWIHLEDVIHMYIFALENKLINGAYNMVAPHPVTNEDMTIELAKVLKKPLWLPHVPAWALKLLMGEMVALILDSTKVNAHKIIAAGFAFKFPDLHAALRNICRNKKSYF